ncbi:MAG: glycosyltransferase, partial [Chitinophagaceae bacterium]
TIAVISMIRDAWGGSEELWYEMAKLALKNGHRVVHLAFENPQKHQKLKELEALGLIHLQRPGWVPANAGKKKLAYLGWNYARKKLKDPFKKLFSYQPDAVLYNGTCYSVASETTLLKHLAKRQNCAPKFFIIGHLNNQFIRGISDADASRILFAYKLCKQVFFVSKRNLETAQRQLCSNIGNASIIRNPVNLSSTEMIPFPEIKSTIQLALVGNLITAHKGQDILFQGLSQWEQKDWQLTVYGTGTDLPYLKTLSSYLKLNDQIHFAGQVNDIRTIWGKNHLLLMPSIMEGMPLAVVEAMLCGRICIVTDVGGNAEWISHGTNGFMAEAPTVKALLEALNTAWSKKEQWVAIAENAHNSAMKLYDPHAGATLLNRIIAE